MRSLIFILLFVLSFNTHAENIIGTIKKLKNQKALIFLDSPIDVSAGATLKTSIVGVDFLVKKISPQGTRLIGTFTSGGNLEKGMEIQFLEVSAVVVEEDVEGEVESTKEVDEGFRLGDYRIHIYGAMQLPAEFNAGIVGSYDVSLGLGSGLEFVQEFSFSKGAQFGVGFGGEGYMPQTLESGGSEFVDAFLPFHGYTNLYYYIPMSPSFEMSLFTGGILSLQNFEHKSFPDAEVSMSIGAQFGLGLNYEDVEVRAIYRILNHEYDSGSAKSDAEYNNIVLTLGYNF